ncbi:MAG TPA: PP2C family protein-serine/threonine phosphatase [Thermoanaerobaculia bacterium]
MPTPTQPRKARYLLGIALGLLAFAAGLVLAGTFLPEWRAGRPLDREVYRQKFRELAARGGFGLKPGEPRVALVTRGPEQLEPFRPLGDEGSRWLEETGTAVRVSVQHEASRLDGTGDLAFDFSLDGQPQLLSWWQGGRSVFELPSLEEADRSATPLASLLLAPGETLGPNRGGIAMTFPRLLYPLHGGGRPQHLTGFLTQGVLLERAPGPVGEEAGAAADAQMIRVITHGWGQIFLVLLLAGLFLVLLMKSRLSATNGALLAALTLVTLLPTPGSTFGPPFTYVLFSGIVTLWVFFVWSSGESLLRSTGPGFTTSLDALRALRLGPRGGRALLVGLACGSALAGFRLALPSLAEALPGVWLKRASLELPVFRPLGSPVADGAVVAGGVALALALALRVVPLSWAPVAAAVAAGLFLDPLPLQPGLASLAANALFCGLLAWIARRYGLTALLTASMATFLLPAAAFSAMHFAWMPTSFAVTTGLLAVLALLGFLGITRSGSAEIARLAPPNFVRRLEEERRLRSEMALLATMQRGLLPRELPRIEGYEMAARSVIANEAGGDLYDVLRDDDGYVWIAAGDVAGHGYSCAIAQAMTKSALASLAGRGRTPAEVLHRMDRVLQEAGPKRNFTSLALLRLRPGTGEALVSNAGHPYPVLLAGEEIRELEMPGLPLGMGPRRHYQDHPLTLPPGAALVFCSDGLFEASDGGGRVYGFDRLRQVLRDIRYMPADRILDALFADWRHHLRATRSMDDTTVVVLKRGAG